MHAFDLTRRDFMKLAAVPLLPIQSPPVDPWQETSAILGRIKDPVFPDRDFDVSRYKSINDAIAACSEAGGGRVIVPAGIRTIDPIRLRSRVNLHLSEGAILKFTTDPQR